MNKVKEIWWKFYSSTLEVMITDLDGKEFSIAEMDICDRDIDEEEDAEYFQNLAEEITNDLNYYC